MKEGSEQLGLTQEESGLWVPQLMKGSAEGWSIYPPQGLDMPPPSGVNPDTGRLTKSQS